MVDVLVIGPKVREFEPGRVDGFLMAIKVSSVTSFGWYAKPSVPCRRILRQVKETYMYEKDSL
jgi:hypothetical protein